MIITTEIKKKINKLRIIATIKVGVGLFFTIINGIITLASISVFPEAEPADIPFGILITMFFFLMLLGSIIPLITGSKTQKLITLFYFYNKKFEADPEKRLSTIVLSMKVPIEQVVKNTNKMIELGLFPNAWIDTRYNTLMFPEDLIAKEKEAEALLKAEAAAAKVAAEMKRKKEKSLVTVICEKCGGTTKIPLGSVGKCDYCDSPIRAGYYSFEDIFS